MSSSLEGGFEPDTQGSALLMALQQQELIDQDRAQAPPTRRYMSPRRYRPVQAEDRLELLVEVLHRQRAQLVQRSPHLGTFIAVGIPTALRRDEKAALFLAELFQGGIAILLVPQQKGHSAGHLAHEGWCLG